jgi:penicillin-binding protein 2
MDTINTPMLDRTIQGRYPPGSIFKPILGLIALQEKTTHASRTIYCSGEYVINEKKGFSQGCRQHPTPFDIEKALQYSCNTYFYQLIRELIDNHGYHKPGIGLAILDKYLEEFGLGKKLGVDMGNENDGFIPTPAYFDKMYNTSEYSWRSTYVLSLGIGQGELGLTTIQMANLVAILANKGDFYTPHLIKKYISGKPINEKFKILHSVPIDKEYFEPVLNGMEAVISKGTGRRAYVPGIRICGKTGTSQNPHGADHSVFFGFAPREDPKIAIAVFIENAGGGGALAAPIGGLMIEKYLKKEIKPSRTYLENYVKERNLINIP